jgi:hypothetical protein
MKKELYISTKANKTGENKKLVKVIKIIEVAGNQCFFYKGDYYALVHLKTGLQLFPSFKPSFKRAEIEIMERVSNNLESLEKAFKNRSGDFEVINGL